MMRLFVCLSLCLSLLGCEGSEGFGGATQAIVAPFTEDTADPPRFSAVVRVGERNCSGTLITPSHVLTAAHCVNQRHFPSAVFFGPRADEPYVKVRVAACGQHPQYIRDLADLIRTDLLAGREPTDVAIELGDRCAVLNDSAEAASFFDVAVLTLARPVPYPGPPRAPAGLQVEPIPLLDGGLIGPHHLIAVGFGFTTPARTDFGTRRYRDLGTRNLAATDISIIGSILEHGDSGGPLLSIDLDGVPSVLGVARTGTGYRAAWTDVTGTPGLLEEAGTWIRAELDQDEDGQVDLFCPLRPQNIDNAAGPDNDQDGDGHLDINDSCPTVYNPCQLTGDADEDGVFDDCDPCPADATIANLRFDGSLPDDDDDGWPNVCDCERTNYNSFALDDVDGDGSMNRCDNCIEVPNPDQRDSDGDLIGDLCDNCPQTRNRAQADTDGRDVSNPSHPVTPDGVGNACDNCEHLYNPLQANCNADAERDLGLPAVGDMCDPTPCGETRLQARFRDEEIDGLVQRVLRQDIIEVDGMAPADAESQDLATGFRFCPCSAATGDDVESRIRCSEETFGGCILSSPTSVANLDNYDAVREDKPWRFNTMQTAAGGTGLHEEPPVDYSTPTPGLFEPTLALQWDSRADRDRWRTIAADEQAQVDAGTLAIDDRRFPEEENQYGPTEEFPGVLWTHTSGETPDSRFPNEVRRLSSHYWSGSISPPLVGRQPFPCLRYAGSFVPDVGHFGAVFPVSFIGTGGDIVSGGPVDNCESRPEPPLLVLPELPIDLAPVIAFDPGPLFRQPDLTWLTPSEPVARWPENHAALVAFDGNGQLAVRLEQTGQGLLPIDLGQGQGQGCPPYCDTTPFPGSAALPGSPGSSSPTGAGAHLPLGPISGSGAVHVLSATRDIAWSFTGDGVLVAQGIRSGASSETIVPGLAGRQIKAATYRAEDDRLYVLATRREWLFGWWPIDMVELISMPALFSPQPASDAIGIKVERTWPTVVAPDHFALVSGADGSLWTFGSHADHHFVLRLEQHRARHPRRRGWRHRHDPIRHGPVRWVERAVEFGDGALTDIPMRSDERGVSLVVRRDALEEIIGYRHEELRRFRRRHLRRCF